MLHFSLDNCQTIGVLSVHRSFSKDPGLGLAIFVFGIESSSYAPQFSA